MVNLHPIVFWGQTKDYVLLSIKIKNVKNSVINILEESFDFSAEGEGSSGLQTYSFEVKYFLPVLPKASSWKVKENFVEVKLRKEFKEAWQRLTLTSEKIPWLKCDFNNFFFDESDYGSDESDKQLQTKKKDALMDIMDKKAFEESNKFYQDVTKPLNLYLLLFNLFQYAGYLYVFGACLWVVIKDGPDGRGRVFALTRDQLATVQIVAILEIVHAYLGWVKSSPLTVCMQVFGRNMVLFCIVWPHEQLHTDPKLYWLILTWSMVEIVRYPYYLLIIIGEQISFLTWLRYTIWIPLYPIGFMCEGLLILKAMPLLLESKKFSISLPNKYNIHVNFVSFLYIYIPMACFGFYGLMMRMYSQRRTKIGPVVKKDWSRYNFLQYLVETLGPRGASKAKPSKTPRHNPVAAPQSRRRIVPPTRGHEDAACKI